MVDPRFNGPAGSANGGYACGVAAGALTDGPAEVMLRRPPPLGVSMDVVETDEGVELQLDGQVVAMASKWSGSTSRSSSAVDGDGVHRQATIWEPSMAPGKKRSPSPSAVACVGSNAPDGSTSGPAVLGRLGVRIDRRPDVGEALVVGGWQTGADGRKLFAGAAVWAADGEVLASASATWIVLDPRQAEAIGTGG